MQKLKMQSADITAQNIEKIAALFPNCVTEREHNGKLEQAIDFDLLKQELSRSIVEGKQERYQLNWVGKADATVLANTPINKTLRPCREESVNFDSTENLFIEGDNLDALKLLQETYLGKVKMIYIDPPYNTGKDFIYKDNFAMENREYQLESGQVDEEGNRLVVNSESNGRFHSDWLSMMYSRLKLARNLLTDDGVIFISIDDNEQANLKRICDEVFGEQNFIASLIVNSNSSKNNARHISVSHEYSMCYVKSKIHQIKEWKIIKQQINAYESKANQLLKMGLSEDEIHQELLQLVKYPRFYDFDHFTYADKNGVYETDNSGGVENGNFTTKILHPITNKPCAMPNGGWRYKDETLKQMVENGQISFGKDETIIPRIKRYLHDYREQVPKSNIFFDSQSTTKWLKSEKLPFDFPKAIELVQHLLSLNDDKNALILDFFAGSATTAHAVMQLNAEDGGNRKFIMVQIPEKTDEKSEAYKAGYQTIAEISKERIRRAGQKIVQELADNQKATEHLDIGFRVLKIDSSNMADIYYTPQQLQQGDMFNQVEHIKADRSEEDLLFQVLLDWGVDLTLPIEKREINGKNVFFVDQSVLVACFDKEIDEELIKAITQYQPLRAVFRDDGFINDTTKINAEQLFKQLAPHSELRVI